MGQLPYVPGDDEEEETEAGDATGDVADSDLVAAAEAAFKGVENADPKPKEEPKKAVDLEEKPRDEKGKFVPAKKEEPQPAKPSSIIARELAKREAAHAEERGYKSKVAEAENMFSQARTLLQQVQSQAQDLAKEKAALLEARKDPAAFMKTVGWTAEQFIDNATRAKDPTYQETLALRELLSSQSSVIEELKQTVSSLQAKAKTYDEQGEKAKAQAEVQEFWTSIPQDSPMWEDYEDHDDILYFAKKVRQRYFDATGKVASPKQVGEYLHYRALQKRAGAPEQSAGQKPVAGQRKAKVPRALGGSDASERRGGNGVKHVHDMTPDEERQYLMDVATNAVTGSDA